MAAFFHHIVYVVLLRAKEKMGRINTRGIIAMVQNIQPGGNHAFVNFVRDAMGCIGFSQKGDSPITLRTSASLPFPAFVLSTPMAMEKEALINRMALAKFGIVARDKFHGLVLGPSSPPIICFGDWGQLPASAHAQAAWVWASPGVEVRLSLVMTNDIASRLPFDVTAFCVCQFGNWCRQTTTAFAKFNKGKFWLGGRWGILTHVISSLLASDRAGGDSQSLPGVFIAFSSNNYTTIRAKVVII